MSNVIQVPFNFEPRWYQLPVFQAMDGAKGVPDSGIKRTMLLWHRRSGKDKACWNVLLNRAIQNVGNYFYVFPTATDARRALWRNIDKAGFALLDHIPSFAIKRKLDQEMFIELINGSTIQVLGLDKNPNASRGVAARGTVFSEFAFSQEEAYKTMVPAIREANGWAIFNSTPNGRNHYCNMWNRNINSPNWFCSKLQTLWPDRDNYSGLVLPEELQFIQDEDGLTTEDMEREFGVSFSTGMSGSYYSKQVEEAYSTDRVGEFPYIDYAPVDTFWDIGHKDNTVVWFRQRIGNKLVFIDYYEDSGKKLQEYVQMLADKGYEYGTHYFPHDGAQHNIQTGMRTSDMFSDMCNNYGISSDVWTLDKVGVQTGINAVRARFSRYCFDLKCTPGLKHLELYHRRYDRLNAVFGKDPVHDEHSDAADALRMEAISGNPLHDKFFEINNIQPPSSDTCPWL